MVYQAFLRYLFCYNTINSMHLGGYKIKVSNVWLHYPQIESLQTLSSMYTTDMNLGRMDVSYTVPLTRGGATGAVCPGPPV